MMQHGQGTSVATGAGQVCRSCPKASGLGVLASRIVSGCPCVVLSLPGGGRLLTESQGKM